MRLYSVGDLEVVGAAVTPPLCAVCQEQAARYASISEGARGWVIAQFTCIEHQSGYSFEVDEHGLPCDREMLHHIAAEKPAQWLHEYVRLYLFDRQRQEAEWDAAERKHFGGSDV